MLHMTGPASTPTWYSQPSMSSFSSAILLCFSRLVTLLKLSKWPWTWPICVLPMQILWKVCRAGSSTLPSQVQSKVCTCEGQQCGRGTSAWHQKQNPGDSLRMLTSCCPHGTWSS